MELFARLENIEFHIKQLKKKCDILEKDNEQLRNSNTNYKSLLETKTQSLLNLEETNKISKLAQDTTTSADNSAFSWRQKCHRSGQSSYLMEKACTSLAL